MASKIEEKLDFIKARFDPDRYDVLEIAGSFRITLDTGHHVYIYPDTYDNSITVRIELAAAHPDKCQANMQTIRNSLAQILPFVVISDFDHTQTTNTKMIYTAGLNMGEPQEVESVVVSPPSDDREQRLEENLAKQFDVMADNPELRSRKRLVTIDELQELLGMLDPYAMERGLDWMYIDKSSRVRAALNKIFKSKADKGKLISTLQDEARKLSAPEDRQELELVKHINRDIVLQPVINVFCHIVSKLKK